MRIKATICLLTLLIVFGACATKRHVTPVKMKSRNNYHTAALVPQEGNSPEMNSVIHKQLIPYGIKLKPSLNKGTRKSNKVDLIITYSDVWRWDMKMYLKSISIDFHDASSGDLLVTGRWDNSPLHWYYEPKDVVKELFDEMFSHMSASN